MELYKIDELGKKWNKSVNDILRMIVAEKLKWWFRKPVTYSFQNQSDLYKLGDPFVAGMFLEKNDTYMMYCHGLGEPCKYYLENFVIFSNEVARVEAEYPDLLQALNNERRDIAGKHPLAVEEPVIGWKKLEAAFDGLSRNTIKKMARTAKVNFRKVGRSPALLPSEIVTVKAFGSKK